MGCCSSAQASQEKYQASLRAYFLTDYKGGGAFQHHAYEHDPQSWSWMHKKTGIKVWEDAVDLTQSHSSGDIECFFHYTSELGFRNITEPSKQAVEVFASLVTEGEKANAWWGQGVYTVRKAPDEWPNVASLIDNNFRNMHRRDVELKGQQAADEEYRSRVAYCIPILADSAITYDVSVQQTPEMKEKGKPPGVNLADKLLDGRECIVIRVEREDQVGNASAVLLNTLRLREQATADRLGPEHGHALLALGRLARVLLARGAFAEAAPLYRRQLEATERLHGAEHRNTLTAAGNLAMVLQDLGRLAEAEPLYRRAVAGGETQLGRDHPDTLIWVNNLALLLESQGKLDEAEELLRRALEGRQAQLGATHPDTLGSLHNLAAVLKAKGSLEEAGELFRRALEGREAELGPLHPETLISVWSLADLLKTKGSSLTEAEDLYRRAVGGFEAQLGALHPHTLSCIYGLAQLLEAKGSLEEAEQLYLRELRGMEELHGPDHEETQARQRNLQRFRQEHGPIG